METTHASGYAEPLPISRDIGPAALHEAVYADLYKRIRSGEYQPDMRLPGERELSAAYGVSRVTVRQALAKAEREGLLTKAPGRGTFVSRPAMRVQDVATVRPFRASLREVAMRPGYELRSSRWIPAPAPVAEVLGLKPETPVLQLQQLGLGDGQPQALYTVCLGPLVANEIGGQFEALADRSTYELAAAYLGINRIDVDQVFEAVTLTEAWAELLQVAPGSSAFRTVSTYATVDGRKLEWREAIYPGDRYKFRAHRVLEL